MVNGSMPRSSSSRTTRIANASESNPVSCSGRSSWSGASVTFCSSAICCIAEKILDLTDMEHLTSQEKRLFEPMLESDSGLHDAHVDGPVDRTIVTGFRIAQEQRVAHDRRIESLADQPLLLLLEGLGDVERPAEPDEDRKRIDRKPAPQLYREDPEIETLVRHQSRHAGAAVGAGDGDAVGRGVENAGAIPDRVVPLAGRDVLALPAEGVADPGDEMEVALLIAQHQIAGAEPGIPFGKDIAQYLLLGLGRVRVALERAAAPIGGADAPDRLADLAGGAGDAEPVVAADRAAAVGIDLYDRGGKAMRQQRRDPADRAGFSFDVEQRKIAFRRGVEFEDLRNREPPGEPLPDVAAQSVADGQPQPVSGL